MFVKEYIDAGLVHSVHTSERKAFRACRRRWDWSYRQNFHPVVTPKPLEFGIAWHVAMETWYDPRYWRMDRELAFTKTIAEFSKTVAGQLQRYKELNGDPSEEVLKDYEERVDLGIKMVKYYTQRVSPQLDAGLTPLAVEIPFEVPLGFNCKCKACRTKWSSSDIGISHHDSYQEIMLERTRRNPNVIINNRIIETINLAYEEEWEGLPVTFGGRIDAIFEDLRGRILVFDWKSTERIIDDLDQAAFLQLDDQVGGYPAALYKLGRQVDGFIYHEQKKAVPERPVPLKRAYQGKLYSVSKTNNYEYPSYLDEIMRNDLAGYNNGLYDDYLEYLSGPMGPKFFQRHTVYKTDVQMENFWNDLIAEAKDMLRDPSVYPQPSRFSCNSCLYRQPCEGKNRGEDYQYTLDSMFIGERA